MTAIETIGATATIAAGPVFTAVTPFAGQSLQVRNTELTNKITLNGVWAQGATAMNIRIRSPRMHDVVNGIRLRAPGAVGPADLLPGDLATKLYPQDTPTVEINGTAAEVDLIFLTYIYDTLEGADGRFATWDQVKPRIVNLTSNDIAIAAGAAAAWSAGTAFSAGSWAPYPNTDYAVLGWESATLEGAIAIAGVDTGSLKVGGPGGTDPEFTRDYFKRDAIDSGQPRIPIVNSANNGTILAFCANVAGTGSAVSFLLAQLA
jgi:hypothetical protein